ncbi:MAG: O-antigen ligase family protein [Prevotella sp.]|nr:O-antigen ligase family protein [Prevotella sp.]
MLIAWIIFVAYTFFALYDIKKAIIIWIPAHVLTNPQIALKYTPPAVSLSIAITSMLCVVFLVKYFGYRRHRKLNSEEFVLKPVFVLMLFSYAVSYILTIASLKTAFNLTVRYFLEGFVILYTFQRCLNDKADMRLFIKATVIVVLLITGLGVYEFITLDNPVLDYVYFNSPHNSYTAGRLAYFPGFHRLRYGLPRCYSFFPLHLRFGAACVFFLLFIGVMFKDNVGIVKKKYVFLLICLLIIGVVAANSKQGMVGLVALAFCFFKPKEVFNYRFFLILAFIGLIWWQYPSIFNNLLSLFDDELAEEGRGSTVALRQQQYAVAWEMFKMNPIFGNGPGTLGTLKNMEISYEAIRGAESIFLSLLPERGLIGAFVYLFMYAYLFYRLKGVMPKRVLLFYLLTVFVVEVAGGRKDITLYWGVLIATSRYYQLFFNKM